MTDCTIGAWWVVRFEERPEYEFLFGTVIQDDRGRFRPREWVFSSYVVEKSAPGAEPRWMKTVNGTRYILQGRGREDTVPLRYARGLRAGFDPETVRNLEAKGFQFRKGDE